ncbi:dienelactone hydrolase family protein [Jiulongibacter sp. NS-SX5]|uniref:dienelactone hydrolase family protein n=1 Tax=Jiulongibacter sp. NS-SX5 TaxID=3463854 RepID=UPI0040587C41
MKIIIQSFVFILAFFPFILSNQKTDKREITICHGELPSSMADFVSDPEFVRIHAKPKQVLFEKLGTEVNFGTPDGTDAAGYFIKAKTDSDKWLFVYQEWWGLNDNIRREADQFYTDLNGEVNILALDMYDGKNTSDPSEAGKLMSGADQNRLKAIIEGGYQYAGQNAKVANVGWCFGGGLSLKSALIGGSQNVGSVMYYGMPVDDMEQLKTLSSDVLGIFATEKWISQEIIEKFAANMEKADKKLTYKIFPGVHGFANPSNPNYDADNTKIAYGMALGYLKTKFGV